MVAIFFRVLRALVHTHNRTTSIPAKPESVHGILKIGFEVADLDGLYSRARERHLDVFFEPTQPAGNPLRTFALKDPDGNIVQFFGK